MCSTYSFLTAALFALVTSAAACSTNSTSLEQQWLAPTARQGELRNVVTICPSSNETVRRVAEDKLAQKIAARGTRAVPGYSVLTPSDLQDRDRMAAALRRAGFDGVVVMRFVDREQKLTFDPYYDAYWGDAWAATIPETVVRVEINAYALDQNKGLVWAGMSRSVDPDGIGNLIEEVTEVASRELDEQRLLSKKQVL